MAKIEVMDDHHQRLLLDEIAYAIRRVSDVAIENASRPSVLFRPTLSLDGNQYCALYGDDIMSGCAGFGETIHEAMTDFDQNWKGHASAPHKESRESKSHYDKMKNKSMQRKLQSGAAIDLSRYRNPKTDTYELPEGVFQKDKDYCDANEESWIFSIGKNQINGKIVAARDARFYGNSHWDCLWLR